MAQRVPYHKPRGSAGASRDYEGLDDRMKAKRFYAGKRWRSVRDLKLRTDPLCEPCLARGDATPAQQVHHRQERRLHPELAFDWDNLESVCIPCHNAKRTKAGGPSMR